MGSNDNNLKEDLSHFMKMSSDNKVKFYGCFLGNHEKIYRWQCKMFDSERDATEFANQNADKINSPLTMLVSVENYVPGFLHHYQIQKVIRQITYVDILQK